MRPWTIQGGDAARPVRFALSKQAGSAARATRVRSRREWSVGRHHLNISSGASADPPSRICFFDLLALSLLGAGIAFELLATKKPPRNENYCLIEPGNTEVNGDKYQYKAETYDDYDARRDHG